MGPFNVRAFFRSSPRFFASQAYLRPTRLSFIRAPFADGSASTFQRSRTKWQSMFQKAQQQKRGYGRQAFNYQTFQASQGLLKRWAARPTFYYEIGGITVVCAGFYVTNLEQIPVSGRYRFNVISANTEKQLGEQMYQQTMQEFGSRILPEYTHEHRLVQRVLNRLIPHSGLENEDWEVHVIDDPMKNAFVIPGGKVFVFKGIMNVAQGEDGLAAVLGHEIAHNVAHHAAERMSQAFIFLPIAIIGSLLFGLDPTLGRMGVNLAFQLPGSRRQEAEADYIGLLMMAQSCYDPTAAMGLWSRMEKEEKNSPPQFLSTHPSSHNRLEKIREWLPKAESAQAEAGCGGMGQYLGDFRQRNFDVARF